jgi:hypothetical protein
MRSYVWWARKSEDASNNGNPQDPVLDDEILESDEDDQHEENDTEPANVTNVPLPTTTVEQLSALAVSSKDDHKEEGDKAPSKETVSRSDKDTVTPAS